MNEALIVKRCIEGNSSAQTYLYNKYKPAMLRLVSKYIDCPHVAEEVCNNGFVRFFLKLELYNFTGSLEGWLKRIMFHSVSDAVDSDDRIKGGKKNLRRSFGRNILYDNEGNERSLPELSVMPDMKHDYKQLLNLLDTALTPSTSMAFKMYLEGLTHMQIATHMGITEGTSKWHISNAKQILKTKVTNN